MYQLDGSRVNYQHLIDKVVEAIWSDVDVHYAYHMGVDIYWIDTHAPEWSDLVRLEKGGLMIKHDKVIEKIPESEYDEADWSHAASFVQED